jgi:hypothetical protein
VTGQSRPVNLVAAGGITGPVITPDASDRPVVRVRVDWGGGAVEWVTGTAAGWTREVVLVDYVAGGLRRWNWFTVQDVRRT